MREGKRMMEEREREGKDADHKSWHQDDVNHLGTSWAIRTLLHELIGLGHICRVLFLMPEARPSGRSRTGNHRTRSAANFERRRWHSASGRSGPTKFGDEMAPLATIKMALPNNIHRTKVEAASNRNSFNCHSGVTGA